MWIHKQAYTDWAQRVREAIDTFKSTAVAFGTAVAAKNREIESLTRDVEKWRGVVDRQRATVAEAQKQLAVAHAYNDMMRLQLNEAREERAAFLKRITEIDLPVPHIEHHPDLAVMGSGVDFDDMGDASARMMGLADTFDIPTDRPENAAVTGSEP
jgi:hypothetical protein